MNIAIIITQSFEPEAGGVQRTTDKLYEIFQSYNHSVLIISFSKQEVFNKDRKIVYIIDSSNLEHCLETNNIELCINQSGYSLEINKKIGKAINHDTFLVNTLRINPLNFYTNHKQIVSAVLKSKGLSILDNAVFHKLVLYYHIIKQRYELNYIIKNSDAFVMLSERFKSELYFLAPGLKKYDHKIFGINNPFVKPEIEISSLNKENIILYVGRLELNQKRVDLLLQIWKRLHSTLKDWRFVVVGDGPEKKMMQRYCAENNLNRVSFLGRQIPDEYYKKAKIFHLTSAYEGFGNVLVEAQSYGCVPIMFDSYPAASEIVNHNRDGVLVKPFCVDTFVQKTVSLAHNKDLLSEMSHRGYINTDRFSYNKTYGKWNNVFKSIINNNAGQIDPLL
ncbi:Glycosyltransferase involved in cell wall bisynthesis [Cyclonatronum proteinivorum]|uniref:Glycosyltransferase involved in cell wall bisynthesis n=1 Tax=Cyclonatronum proteinivorum TaxID=1457365 RepID=A0A345UMI8_9BACT|nr:glycosyltransferase [Cyclonatronum proteinivorum]AXJ01690.1 Glycosyltransferase involved in cell wall bisynthesis [Cyclonatronum proteinivorum]